MNRPPLAVILAAVLVLGAAGAWLMSRTASNPATRECRRLYVAARTAQDTLTIDTTVTAEARQLAEPRSCGSFRHSARWQ